MTFSCRCESICSPLPRSCTSCKGWTGKQTWQHPLSQQYTFPNRKFPVCEVMIICVVQIVCSLIHPEDCDVSDWHDFGSATFLLVTCSVRMRLIDKNVSRH